MTRFALALIGPLLALPARADAAQSCEALQARIEARIRASGVQAFSLRTVDAAAKVDGKVVGSCDLGTKKIVYLKSGTMAKSDKEAILTECKDGTVSVGGDCRKQP